MSEPAGDSAAAANEAEAEVKVVLLGDSGVGKSKLVERFLMDDYVPKQLSTFALALFRHQAKLKGEDGAVREVEVDFWDTAGQERFSSMHPSYYYRAHACILVFDVTRKETYVNLKRWYRELQQYRKGIPTLVVANKIDVDYEVTKKSFAFASKRKLPFFFCSAADGINVVDMFNAAVAAAVAYKDEPPTDFTEEVMRTLQYIDEQERDAGDPTSVDVS